MQNSLQVYVEYRQRYITVKFKIKREDTQTERETDQSVTTKSNWLEVEQMPLNRFSSHSNAKTDRVCSDLLSFKVLSFWYSVISLVFSKFYLFSEEK